MARKGVKATSSTNKRHSTVLKAFLFSMLIVIAALATFIAVDGLSDELHSADVAVVMGTTANLDGSPSRWLKTRLDKAVEVYKEGLVSHIIVSGGRESSGVLEGDVMRNYLTAAGIPESAILVDNDGVDSFATAGNVATIMRANEWSSVMVVSQFYHIPRVKLALKRFGIVDIYGAHAEWITGMAVIWLAREVIAYPVYFFRAY
jgi:vancomycin permeability regulator SanA